MLAEMKVYSQSQKTIKTKFSVGLEGIPSLLGFQSRLSLDFEQTVFDFDDLFLDVTKMNMKNGTENQSINYLKTHIQQVMYRYLKSKQPKKT